MFCDFGQLLENGLSDLFLITDLCFLEHGLVLTLLAHPELVLDLLIVLVSLKNFTKIGLLVQILVNYCSLLLHIVLQGSTDEPAALLHEAEDIVRDAIHLEQLLLKHEDHLAVLRLLVVADGVGFFAQGHQRLASLAETNGFWGRLYLEVSHLLLDVIRVQDVIDPRLVGVHEVNQVVNDLDYVISTGQSLALEGVVTRENNVADEGVNLFVGKVLALGVDVLTGNSEIDHEDVAGGPCLTILPWWVLLD